MGRYPRVIIPGVERFLDPTHKVKIASHGDALQIATRYGGLRTLGRLKGPSTCSLSWLPGGVMGSRGEASSGHGSNCWREAASPDLQSGGDGHPVSRRTRGMEPAGKEPGLPAPRKYT